KNCGIGHHKPIYNIIRKQVWEKTSVFVKTERGKPKCVKCTSVHLVYYKYTIYTCVIRFCYICNSCRHGIIARCQFYLATFWIWNKASWPARHRSEEHTSELQS